MEIDSVFGIPLEKAILEEVVEISKDWALMHGACMRSKTNFSRDSLSFAPFTLFPSPIPKTEFEYAVGVQKSMNLLFHRVAHDHRFLSSALRTTIELDPFTKRLYDVYEAVRSRGAAQTISLGMVRNDVMLEAAAQATGATEPSFKQVEFNTVSAGFGWLGPVSADIHRFVLQHLGHEDKLKNLPENKALSGLCQGIVDAWNLFNEQKQTTSVVLFVVEDVSYNICDQRFMEFEIRRLSPVTRVIRRSIAQLSAGAELRADRTLVVDGVYTIGVVYYRAGYDPAHYRGDVDWTTRLDIELSTAIKCPSVQYHLAGTKKVQQVLSQPGVVEKFLSDPEEVAAVRRMFTNIYPLDFTPEGDTAAGMAVGDPARYVMKPQREGGGNNVYGGDIAAALAGAGSASRPAWILMERIRPPLLNNYIIRPGGGGAAAAEDTPEVVKVVSELGVFGVIIGDADRVLANRAVGHMLRTKKSDIDEGGVAAGHGALDSPYLV